MEDSMVDELHLEQLQWIIQGNVVISTRNPCLDVVENDEEQHASDNILNLGCGLIIQLNHIVSVNISGIISHVEPSHDFFSRFEYDKCCSHPGYLSLPPTAFLCPGLIDLHIHAPQYAFAGTGTDRQLMGSNGWLETYTFPTEAGMRDLHRARRVYQAVVKRTLSLGTTTAVYFATLDAAPTKLLVDVALERGQRALIGKVCMDRNAPENYCQSTEENLQQARDVMDYILKHASPRQQTSKVLPLVLPLVTPRFIPTCTPQLLDGLGALAKEYQCHITSHISESLDQVHFSKLLAEQDYDSGGGNMSDASVFHSHSLLTSHCILAHGVHLTETDLDLLKQQGSAVAHCPLSNFFFAGGSLPCQSLLKRGNKVGLGTDIAGGYHPSVMESARSAVVASLALKHQQQHQQQSLSKDDPTIDYRHAFWLATVGGAESLGLQDRIGSLKAGMEFDAMVLLMGESADNSFWPDSLDFDDSQLVGDIFQKIWNLSDDRNISHVFVQGHLVHHRSSP
jgi:guanine deaminase